jgi:hypothetical protein
MASKGKPTPRIHELKPQKTIQAAVAAAHAHVQAVNAASKGK